MVVSLQRYVDEKNALMAALRAESDAETLRQVHLELFLQDLLADLLAA